MKVWFAFYNECLMGDCDSAIVAIRADTYEEALDKAKPWAEITQIKLTSVEEFIEEATLLDAHYA